MNFNVGDIVVYPTHGVGQVQAIEDMPVAGMSLRVLIVTFEDNLQTLRIPVKKAHVSGLRHLSTPEAINKVREALRSRTLGQRVVPGSLRIQDYQEKINSGDPIELAEVVRDLHYTAAQPEQFPSEQNLYWVALHRIAAEIARIENISVGTARANLLNALGENKNKVQNNKIRPLQNQPNADRIEKYQGPKKFIIAGTFATDAFNLYKAKILKKGAEVSLRREPSNHYDHYAVAVLLNQIRIGYVPRNQNQKLLEFRGERHQWIVLSINRAAASTGNVAVEIYCPDGYVNKNKKPIPTKRIPTATRPEFADVNSRNIIYAVIVSGKTEYIGKTNRRLSDRMSEHLNLLRNGTHHNMNLQLKFYEHGEENIEFKKVKSGLIGVDIYGVELDVMKKRNKRQYKETKSRMARYKRG
jgi:RNA polymerase-interacting CarD/CdnL/TRCF family regulator